MMKNRVIKFRAKRVSDGSWVYGDLNQHPIHYPCQIIENGVILHSVDPETVCQFIGVKGYEGEYKDRHKNEVELFEGDIVEAMSQGSKGTFRIKFRTESAPCYILFPAWFEKEFWSIRASDLGRGKGDYYDDLKVIGNIFDNPEKDPSHENK